MAARVTKQLVYVFEDEAPLPSVRRWNLADGLFLSQLPTWLLSQDDDLAVMLLRPQFSDFFEAHLHRTTLNVNYSGSSDLNYESTTSDESVAQAKVNRYILAAMIAEPTFCVPYGTFVIIPSTERVCHTFRMRDFGPVSATRQSALNRRDFNRIEAIYDALASVFTSIQAVGRLVTASRYYQQAHRLDIDWSVRFLGMMMAMESLFSCGASEVSHQVSERTAFFLMTEPEDREHLYAEMKRHYSLRSKIAHGRDVRASNDDVANHFEGLHSILRQVLIAILLDSDLRSLFHLANAKRLDESLRKLVFRGEIEL